MEPHSPILESIPALEADIPSSTFAADNLLMVIIATIGGLVLLAGFGLLLWSVYGRKRPTATPPSPEALALADLTLLEKEMPPLRPCALRLSLILRNFLAGQTQDPALYETHEEFSHRIDSLASLPASCQYDMRCLLETLAEQKYAATGAEVNATRGTELIEQARQLVQRITAEQAREAAERTRD